MGHYIYKLHVSTLSSCREANPVQSGNFPLVRGLEAMSTISRNDHGGSWSVSQNFLSTHLLSVFNVPLHVADNRSFVSFYQDYQHCPFEYQSKQSLYRVPITPYGPLLPALYQTHWTCQKDLTRNETKGSTAARMSSKTSKEDLYFKQAYFDRVILWHSITANCLPATLPQHIMANGEKFVMSFFKARYIESI